LDGQVVGVNRAFVQKGGTVDPADGETSPLTVESDVLHPQLHDGCDCVLTVEQG